MIYSHSSINTFKTCPLKFKYNYIEKPDIEKKQNAEAFMGSMVHDTLEKLYTDLKYKKLLTLEETLNYLDYIWNKNYDPNKIEIIRKDYIINNYKKLAKEYVTQFYNTNKPFNDSKILGLELKVNLSFYDEKLDKYYNLVGYIDRLALKEPNHIEIIDYKTNNQVKTQQQLDQDRQLALYSIAVKKMYPFIEKVDLVWYFLSANVKMKSVKKEFELTELENDIIKDIRDIEIAKDNNNFPEKPSALCDWCEFRSICPVTAHKFKQDKVNPYLKKEGKELINKYQEVYEAKKEIDDKYQKELDDLKDAILNYAKQNNFNRLYGDEKIAVIKEYNSIKLPSKDDPKRKELEDLIKSLNLYNDLSDLSFIKISKFLENNMFSKDFENKLKQYIQQNKITRIYLNKK